MAETKEERIIDGSKIVRVRTMSSQYDKGHLIELEDDNGVTYRASVNDIIVPLLNQLTFKAKKERKYEHLTLQEVDEKDICSACGGNRNRL